MSAAVVRYALALDLVDDAQRIAVLGIGLMGFPMARRLCDAGHAVTAWNRSRDKAERLLPFGAQVADRPADAVRDAERNVQISCTKPRAARGLARLRG